MFSRGFTLTCMSPVVFIKSVDGIIAYPDRLIKLWLGCAVYLPTLFVNDLLMTFQASGHLISTFISLILDIIIDYILLDLGAND